MAVDSPHDDDPVDTLRGRGRDRDDGDVVDAEFSGYDDRPVVRVDREECYTELRAFHAVEMQVGSRDGGQRTSDGCWRWKGLELDAASNRIADAAIAARCEAEGRDADGNYGEAGITPAMRRIEGELEHGSLVPDTERFALKSPDRFKEKLAKLIADEPDKSAGELCREIHDGVRYTFLLEAGTYSGDLETACDQLKANGYELLVLKNTWGNTEYKGINSRWVDRESDVLFEVQFHTAESWSAKQQMHDAYERISDPTTPVDERERLRGYQRNISGQLEAPQGWQEITDYRRKGW
jgi:hypothetical protein